MLIFFYWVSKYFVLLLTLGLDCNPRNPCKDCIFCLCWCQKPEIQIKASVRITRFHLILWKIQRFCMVSIQSHKSGQLSSVLCFIIQECLWSSEKLSKNLGWVLDFNRIKNQMFHTIWSFTLKALPSSYSQLNETTFTKTTLFL